MRHLNKILLALLFTFSCGAHALSSDKDQPIELAADSVDVDEGKGVSVYKGNVDLRQGSMKLLADTVSIKQQGRKPNHITAIGSVRFSQKDDRGRTIKARANKAEYEVNSEVLELTGKASLTQGGDTMHSDRIVYDRVKHKVRAGAAAEGKQRVRITIQPPQ
jgi:lipopolysaccharide export system protein LptA